MSSTMRIIRALAMITIVLFLFGSVARTTSTDNLNGTKVNHVESAITMNSLTVTSPIAINGETELMSYVTTNGLVGNGSEMNPYLFKDLSILSPGGAPAISIQNTHSNIKIDNVYLRNGTYGIYLNSVLNITVSNSIIANNSNHGIFFQPYSSSPSGYVASALYIQQFINITLSGNSHGIYIYGSDGVKIINSTIHNNRYWGIYFDTSRYELVEHNTIFSNGYGGIGIDNSWSNGYYAHNTVYSHSSFAYGSGIEILGFVGVWDIWFENNTITGNDYGIDLGNISNATVIGNTLIDNSYGGLYLDSVSNSHFENNTIQNSYIGIRGGGSIDVNVFQNNLVLNSSNSGIYFRNSDANQFLNNTVAFSGSYAFFLDTHSAYTSIKSENNKFFYNNFIDNNPGGISQGKVTSTTNNATFNYYSDHSGADNDGDGYIDANYTIVGNINDTRPSTSIIPFAKRITPSMLLNSETQITGKLTIKWSKAIDVLKQSFGYDLYYSTDNTTWTLIKGGISEESYVWNTFGMSNTSYYIKLHTIASGQVFSDYYGPIQIDSDIKETLSPPEFITPMDGDTLNGSLRIEWLAASHSWQYPIKYNLYLWNGGWTELSVQYHTFFDWNLDGMTNGSYKLQLNATANDLRTTTEITINIEIITHSTSQSDTTTQSSSTPSQIPDNHSSDTSKSSFIGSLSVMAPITILSIWRKRQDKGGRLISNKSHIS